MANNVEDHKEYGVIATLRKRFGFIKCCSRNLDLFFHFDDLQDGILRADLEVGLQVLYTPTRVSQSDGSSRLVAKKVGRAERGMVIFHDISEHQMLGLIVELPQAKSHVEIYPGMSTTGHETPGLIRYFPAPSKMSQVSHISYSSKDIQNPGRSDDMAADAFLIALGSLVMFRISIDRRALASTRREVLAAQSPSQDQISSEGSVEQGVVIPGDTVSGRLKHAVQHAVDVSLVPPSALNTLSPHLRDTAKMLSMLFVAFPKGRDCGELANQS
ncbi:hypothetical protein CEUSTIGMA_g12925.t1 [Chlamydomonas eustigma]|uniref:CSD domain-containing protein n=1 Tax=Chlamydomonas eustigma TaxID=1157962 RepID=A0A250XRE0_9CHLO|nr:hypothetical protein CEUSTIGMA_g12925.t1 [Chlamydomonas eustigma]|eukprot:GAX85509.1 hypothetical protein CEUSTIGMA_g12925.t1 [Chlamydomonas eustigma]